MLPCRAVPNNALAYNTTYFMCCTVQHANICGTCQNDEKITVLISDTGTDIKYSKLHIKQNATVMERIKRIYLL